MIALLLKYEQISMRICRVVFKSLFLFCKKIRKMRKIQKISNLVPCFEKELVDFLAEDDRIIQHEVRTIRRSSLYFEERWSNNVYIICAGAKFKRMASGVPCLDTEL
jgi:hypothetical protein